MTKIIESINNFGISVYNNEPYFGDEYKLRTYNNITYKCKIYKEPFFAGINIQFMEIDYIRKILKNEELLNYLIKKEKDYLIKRAKENSIYFTNILRIENIQKIHYDSVCQYLIEKYNELMLLEESNAKKKAEEVTNTIKTDKKVNKPKKKNISQLMKRRVWAKHIGEEIGKTKCLCCNMSDITQLTFNCGHIISHSNGGETNVENLLPICQSCNSSMGTQNLFHYKNEHGL
jgi:hypothetical protein